MPRSGHLKRKSSSETINGLPGSSDSPQQQSPSIKAACLECRSNKVKCKVGQSALACQRCERFGLECRFEAVNRRGRKPKKHDEQNPSSSSSSTRIKRNDSASEEFEDRTSVGFSSFRPLFSDRKRSFEGSIYADETKNLNHLLSKSHQNQIWRALMHNQSMKGSTYTFVSSGEVNIAGGVNQAMDVDQERDDITLRNTFHPLEGESSYQPTLRQLLRPFNKGPNISQRSEASLPLIVRFDTHPDPRAAGVISSARCEELLTYFDLHLLPWIGIFASARDLSLPRARWSSTFLLSTVLYLASRFSTMNGASEEVQALGMHTRSLAIRAFGCADKSLETLLAFNLLTVWKAPDDGYSQLYAGFTDQIATVPRTSTSDGKPLSEHDAADALRIQLFHYVQRSIFQLHHVPMTNMIMDQHGVVLPLPTPSPAPPPLLALERFAAGASTISSDWYLCADVEGSSIQSKYKALFKQHQQGRFGNSRNTLGPQVALLEAFFAEMETWEHRWRRRGLRAREFRRSSSASTSSGQVRTTEMSLPGSEDVQQWAGFEILGHSICMHISSIAFRKGLDVWFETNSQPSFPINDAATAELIQQSYQACLDSAICLLRRITQLHPSMLVHMPDATLILINHAALLVIYFLLIPSAAVEGTLQVGTSGSRRKQFPEVIGNYIATQQECLQSVKAAQEVLRKAASTRSGSTCCALSSDHLVSLIGLIDGSNQISPAGRAEQVEGQQIQMDNQFSSSIPKNTTDEHSTLASTMSSQTGTPIQIQQNVGWEWLRTFLDDTSVNMPLARQEQ